MKYNFDGTKEAYREGLEYKARIKRVEAEILCAEALIMENLAREIFFKLTELSPLDIEE